MVGLDLRTEGMAGSEQINVHSMRGLNWGADDNIVSELAQLNQLINQHRAFEMRQDWSA